MNGRHSHLLPSWPLILAACMSSVALAQVPLARGGGRRQLDVSAGHWVHQRIVYKFASGSRVTVLFQQSKDGTHWETTATGTGEKLR